MWGRVALLSGPGVSGRGTWAQDSWVSSLALGSGGASWEPGGLGSVPKAEGRGARTFGFHPQERLGDQDRSVGRVLWGKGSQDTSVHAGSQAGSGEWEARMPGLGQGVGCLLVGVGGLGLGARIPRFRPHSGSWGWQVMVGDNGSLDTIPTFRGRWGTAFCPY